MKPASVKITTRMVEDEVYEASNEQGHAVTIDMRDLSIRKNQSPVEILLSSLAACGAVDIVLMLKKRRKNILDFTIETTGVRREETPRGFTDIHCSFMLTSPDVTEDELHKITKLSLEKYCSVASTLNASITFSVLITRPT